MATTTYAFQRVNGPDRVNTVLPDNQYDPTVVATSGGAGVVFFQSSANGGQIFARRLDAGGDPIGAQTQVSLGTGAIELEAVRLSNGNILVTWQDGTGATKILGRVYTPTLTPVTGELTLFSDSSLAFRRPDVAATANGGFVVAADLSLNSSDSDIYIRTFDAAGTVLNRTTFAPVSLDSDPTVAVLANGNIAVAWERYVSNQTEIWRAVYDANLGVVTAGALLDTTGSINQDPDAVALPNGNWSLSYADNFTGNVNIFTYTMNPTGGVVASATPSSNSGVEGFPNAAVSSDGYQVIVAEDQTDLAWNVSAGLLGPTGSAILTSQLLEGGAGYQYRPGVTWMNSSTIQVTYTTFDVPEANGGDPTGSGIATSRFNVVRTTTGDSTSETLAGDGLVDVINALGGDDTLVGGGGDDRLIGGTGADTLSGGAGNDLLYVDNTGDVVVEAAGGGTDRVLTSISYVLATQAAVETLTTTTTAGTAAINLTGNALAQTITGNAGANRIDGKGGVDIMSGLGGNDIYYVDNAGDRVAEAAGGGSDFVVTSVSYALQAGAEVERLFTTSAAGTAGFSLTGSNFAQRIDANAGNNRLTGLGGNDALYGYAGADTLAGGAGNDTLIGGLGNDAFLFNTALSASTNVDVVTDFRNVAGNDDRFLLENAVFTRLTATGALNAAFFKANATGTAADSNDFIVYDTTTSRLYYDSNGNGAGGAIQIASLGGGLVLTAADFFVV